MRRRYKALALGAVGAVVVGLVGSYLLTRPLSKAVRREGYEIAAATTLQVDRVAELRVFFGHQSVGNNILDAVPAVFEAAGAQAPEVVRWSDGTTSQDPAILHVMIGSNGAPLEKIEEFDRMIRSGVGDEIDVAILKLCYVDLHEGDDPEQIFAAYRDTMAALERDFPEVVFIYTTMPLTTEWGGRLDWAKTRIKDLLGRESPYKPAHNVVRERYNSLIRSQYSASGRLFDIAAIQSTDASGARVVRGHSGAEYFSMSELWASDPGHLNPHGAEVVASALLATLASAVGGTS